MNCEAWARANAGSAGDAALGGAAGGALLGAAAGAAIGAIAGSFIGRADQGAAIGASLWGAQGGLQGAAGAAQAQDERYVTAYRNCMAARGYVVNGSTIVSAPSAASPDSNSRTSLSAEDRLLRLQALYHDGLITEKELQAARQRILRSL